MIVARRRPTGEDPVEKGAQRDGAVGRGASAARVAEPQFGAGLLSDAELLRGQLSDLDGILGVRSPWAFSWLASDVITM
jgi:hypothetical protein